MRSSIFLSLLAGAAASPLAARQESSTSTSAASVASTSIESTTVSLPTATPLFPIHKSCNSTLSRQLSRAFEETVELATHARDHLLKYGASSPFAKKYFGGNTTVTPLGIFSRVASADRGNMTFRCDDPDKNCATQEGWAGHWRGTNATQETVICDLSFTKRRWLDSLCGLGYTVANSPTNTFWATDLLHRTFHVPQISEDAVHHYAEDFAEVLEMAKTTPEKSAFDSDSLIYFATDVYAYEVAAPGVGCSGDEDDVEE
ncbi:putative peptidase domain-containing protein [Podospora australis]|uniref:Peptidase domain-containing protein n=1 Tax=Podospora australis TaxID=1536484 RepID=A0AAN7AII0_9PEZI|nr:putative peptidase domain-containing protein [Podospora australis]